MVCRLHRLAAIFSELRPDEFHPVKVVTGALRAALRVGARPAGLVAYLHLFPEQLCPASDPYERSVLIADAIANATSALGAGPYGRAAQALFGLTADTKGRMLKDRRRLAAEELDIAVATWRRSYEPDALADISLSLIRKMSGLPFA